MFVVAAAGCGAAGAIVIISQLSVEPTAAFSVQWSAEMIFATIIGGIGTIEGPILGTIVFFALQQSLAQYGTWYFIVLGLVAMAVALWAPRGHLGPDLGAVRASGCSRWATTSGPRASSARGAWPRCAAARPARPRLARRRRPAGRAMALVRPLADRPWREHAGRKHRYP